MDNKYLLSSLENTLRLIDIMAAEQEIGITELSSRMNLGKSTIHRILNTLLKYDYVKQNEATGRYSKHCQRHSVEIRYYHRDAASH